MVPVTNMRYESRRQIMTLGGIYKTKMVPSENIKIDLCSDNCWPQKQNNGHNYLLDFTLRQDDLFKSKAKGWKRNSKKVQSNTLTARADVESWGEIGPWGNLELTSVPQPCTPSTPCTAPQFCESMTSGTHAILLFCWGKTLPFEILKDTILPICSLIQEKRSWTTILIEMYFQTK